MRIVDLLNKDSILLGGAPTSKSEAIDMLIDLQVKGGNIADREAYKKGILAREAMSSTAVGEGIAIPHAKSEAVKAPSLAAMTVPGGVDYEAMDDLDCRGDQSATEQQNETRYEQAHYKCEPATTIEDLETVAQLAKSSSYTSFRTAVKLARPGSASPAESLMFAVLGAPMRFGGFGCCSLPMGGLLLNYRIDFDTLAVNTSSGIPYAICDLYCPAAGVDNEYNGIGHELQNARIHDGNRNNGLKAMGIHVLVINRDQMKDLVALEAFAQTMHRLAGVRFRYRIKGYRTRQAASRVPVG